MVRRIGALAALTVAVAATVAVGTGVAAADEPSVTVAPDHVTNGQTVTITSSGYPAGTIYGFFQCSSAIVGRSGDDVWSYCRLLGGLTGGQPPATFSAAVLQRFPVTGAPIDCATVAGGCVVGLSVYTEDGSYLQDWAPITFAAGPDVVPNRNLVDGDTVMVSAPDLPDGAWTLAQCDGRYLVHQDPTQAGASCGAPVPMDHDGGTASGEITVHEPLVSTDGTTLPCGYDACVVVVAPAGGLAQTVGGLSFGPPAVLVGGAVYEPGSFVEVRVVGLPGTTARLRQCAGSVGPATCDEGPTVALDPLGAGAIVRPLPGDLTTVDGSQVDCTGDRCSLVAEVDGEAVASAPITLATRPTASVSPATGVLDGQAVTVTFADLVPGSAHAVYRCAEQGTSCESIGAGTASAEGDLVLDLPAAHRVGVDVICRDQCSFGIFTSFGWIRATYAMATGSVAATPADGLVDGQQVQLSGTDLMPSYTGRSFGPFPTGGWYATQCEAAAIEQPSLWAAFDGCAAVPGTHLVTVPGSTYDGEVTAQATLTTILGRTVDCTAPGSCVVGLYRFEQDGSSTFVTTPVEFAT